MTSPILLDVVDGVAQITLNRPDRANAFDLPTATEFFAAVETITSNRDVRSVLLTGAGSRFCAGGDVASMVAACDQGRYLRDLASTLDAALQLLDELEKPVVVAVHGAVAGAGLAIMLSGDIIVAAASTRFITAYAGVGLTPDCGLSFLLPRAIGQPRALEMLLTPRTLDASEALNWGLVTEVADDDAAISRATEIARKLADGPARAFGQARALARASWQQSRAEVGRQEADVISRAVLSPEAQDLLQRFAR